MGATGSGKSALAMRLAPALIIACDSMQLYRGLDIGTAKPTREEQARQPHAMLDLLTLPASGDAAWWAEECRAVIRDCNRRGDIPLIVGGTGLYLRALLRGFAEIPPERPEIRLRLDQLRTQRGTPWLHRMLRRVDPELAARLPEHDTQRITRALSVAFSSGRPLSFWQKQPAVVPAIDCPVFVLEREPSALRSVLAQRFHAMMARGWLDEVRWLHAQHLDKTHPAMRAVGYRQLLQHIRGDCSLDDAVRDGITATRRYAKRQRTWFRHQHPDALHGDAQTLQPAIAQALCR